MLLAWLQPPRTHWHVAGRWVKAHPGGIEKLSAMIDEAYALLRSDDSLWPAIAELIGITDPAMVAAYRDLARRTDDAPYTPDLIAATQELLDTIIAIAGDGPIGFTRLDPDAFLFPARHGR